VVSVPRFLRKWKKLGTYRLLGEKMTLHEGISSDSKLIFKNEKGKKVSWITFSFEGKTAGIGIGKTIKKYRKNGLGTALLRQSLQRMKEEGVEHVFVEVMPVFGDTEKVKKLLEREGFEPAGSRLGVPVYTFRNLHRTKLKKPELEKVKE
jgi:GNAT superfamily N-acetyltransferase